MIRGLAIAFILSAPALAQRSINFSWAPGVNDGWAACTSGPACLTGFTLYEITTGTPVNIGTVPQSTTSMVLSPLPSVGSHSYELVQNGSVNGSPVQSSGNPGLVINCRKNAENTGRICVEGKHW